MTLTDYTSPAEVRAVLGLSDDELEDETLALGVFLTNLLIELDDVDVGVNPKFKTLKASSDSGTSLTEEEQRFVDTVKLFSTYVVANQMATGLPLLAPKDKSEGKTSGGRFSDGPYREASKRVKEQYERLRLRLPAIYAAVNASTAANSTRVFLAVSSPSTDPVTGS